LTAYSVLHKPYGRIVEFRFWYLSEATAQFLPNGKADTSGSFEAGVDGPSRESS
jgi:hypothetical protein